MPVLIIWFLDHSFKSAYFFHVACCEFKTTLRYSTVLTLASLLKNKTLVQLGFQKVHGNVTCLLIKQKAEMHHQQEIVPVLNHLAVREQRRLDLLPHSLVNLKEVAVRWEVWMTKIRGCLEKDLFEVTIQIYTVRGPRYPLSPSFFFFDWDVKKKEEKRRE